MKAAAIGAGCLLGWASAFSAAATITQTHSFDAAIPLASDPTRPDTEQNVTTAANGSFAAAFQPFNRALGTLKGVTISWSHGISVDAYTAPSTQSFGGYARLVSVGGTGDGYGPFSVNGVQYGGHGITGAGNGMGPPQPTGSTEDLRTGHFAFANDPFTSTNTFDPINGGADPRVLAAFQAATPYTVSWAMVEQFQLQNIARGTATRTASVVVTYDYTPAVPEPAGLAVCLAAAAVLGRRRRGV